MKRNTASGDGGALPEDRKPLPAFESELYLTIFILCHHRLQALHRIAEGRECPHDDRCMITGAEETLARHGWTPNDFGFVDPPTFDVQPNTGTVFAALDATTVN
jgi:hypothetical protein